VMHTRTATPVASAGTASPTGATVTGLLIGAAPV
jgi:hypothetical protein